LYRRISIRFRQDLLSRIYLVQRSSKFYSFLHEQRIPHFLIVIYENWFLQEFLLGSRNGLLDYLLLLHVHLRWNLILVHLIRI
jgi:hypothetical protein